MQKGPVHEAAKRQQSSVIQAGVSPTGDPGAIGSTEQGRQDQSREPPQTLISQKMG